MAAGSGIKTAFNKKSAENSKVPASKETSPPAKDTSILSKESPAPSKDALALAKNTSEQAKEVSTPSKESPKETSPPAKETKEKVTRKSRRKLNTKKRTATSHAVSVIASELLDKNAEGESPTKIGSKNEQTLRSLVFQRTKTKKNKHGTPAVGVRYDALIKTLEEDITESHDPEKIKALELLQNAKKNNKHLSLEELTQIFDMSTTVKFLDHDQAKNFIERMRQKDTITKDQYAKVLREVESKIVNGKIPAAYLRKVVEDYGKQP